MRSFFNIRTLAASLVLVGCLTMGSTTASAGNCTSAPQCYYKTVVVYEYVKKPVIEYVWKYDHCGDRYRARVVTWKTVRVPVTKRVKICR